MQVNKGRCGCDVAPLLNPDKERLDRHCQCIGLVSSVWLHHQLAPQAACPTPPPCMPSPDPLAQSDSEGEEVDECEWLLGFVEPPRKRGDLLRHRFPSKVGGRPAWLDPLHLPTEEQLTCRVTGKPLDFLLQVPAAPPLPPAACCRSPARLSPA